MLGLADSLHQDVQRIEGIDHHIKGRHHDFVSMPRVWKIILFVSSILLAVAAAALVMLQQPPSWSVGYTDIDGKLRSDSNIAFSFSRPMSRTVTLRVEPEINGNWYFEDKLSRLHLTRTFRFEPLETWQPDTTYTITFDGLRGIFDVGEPAQNIAYTFTTQPSPSVESFLPEENEALSPQTQFILNLDQPNVGLARFTVQMDPDVEFEIVESEDAMQYTYTPHEPLAQGTRYNATVYKNAVRTYRETGEISFEGERESVATMEWKVKEAPGVSDFSPTGSSVRKDSNISITLSETPLLDAMSQVLIEPAVGGTWAVSDKTATYTTDEALAFDTKYTVTVPEGFTTKEAGYFEADAVYTFTTIGAVTVVANSPVPGASGVAADRQIRIDFDQAVNKDSAQSKFSISPSIEGDVAWDGATLIFTPSNNLSLDTTYTVSLASGIESIYGLPSDREYAFSFSTQPTVVKLAVPLDFQDRPLSCEVAALKMALSYKGVSVSETELMNHVGYDPTPHVGNTWGNPYEAFVGNIDGKQSTTGYGVYWDPILRAARVYRSDSDMFVNGAVQTLTDEISKGNPVVVWGNAGSGRRADWYTPEGELIYAFDGEHARTAIGFIGPKNSPSHIIVNDPIYGQITYTTSTFENNWAMLFKAGVIVR